MEVEKPPHLNLQLEKQKSLPSKLSQRSKSPVNSLIKVEEVEEKSEESPFVRPNPAFEPEKIKKEKAKVLFVS